MYENPFCAGILSADMHKGRSVAMPQRSTLTVFLIKQSRFSDFNALIKTKYDGQSIVFILKFHI